MARQNSHKDTKLGVLIILWLTTIRSLPVPFGDWQQTTLRLAKNCTSKREQFSLHIWTGAAHRYQHKKQ